jgi:putative protease
MNQFKAPEILAPAGGPAQFLAALNSGADAVFLGLKTFNARARAENFSIEDLEIYVPLAHRYGMKVLVTLNILIKESELTSLSQTLSDLARLEVDGVIVQDLGLFRLLRESFPSLPIHASTQLAVHNLSGVKMAKRMGAKRVVLARELTAQEIKKIKQDLVDYPVELEAFCHGSLCYSYSGLCFFSGQDDARSGNRGECAYTCRKPYKILNEPGAGFLFSMKDLETVDQL